MTRLLTWIAGDDTGTSSKAIWSHMMTGSAPRELGGASNPGHPLDAGDFGRCYRLLLIEPAWRARIGEMGRHSAEWKALAESWEDLSALYADAVTDPTKKLWQNYDKAKLERLNRLMTATLNHARVCADCGKRGMSGWTTYPGDVKRCSDCAKKHKGGASTVRIGNATMTFGGA